MGFPCYEIVTMTEFQKSAVKGFVETEGINHIVTLAHTHTPTWWRDSAEQSKTWRATGLGSSKAIGLKWINSPWTSTTLSFSSYLKTSCQFKN